MYDDKSINAHNIKITNHVQPVKATNKWFKPFALHLDYYLFYLQVVKVENDWMEIIVNEDSNLKLWLRKTSSLTYLDWNNFLLNLVAVIPKNIETNPLRVAPKVNGEKVKNPLIDCLQPAMVKDNWLQVKIDPTVCDRYEELKDKNLEGGYIRWRKGNKLLIDYFFIL